MKNTKIINMILLSSLTLPLYAIAEESLSPTDTTNKSSGIYFSIGGGISRLAQKGTSLSEIKDSYYDDEDDLYLYKKYKRKDSATFSAAIGRSFNNFRGELEFITFAKKSNNHNLMLFEELNTSYASSIQNNAYLVNLNYDFKELSDIVQPYIGVSLGISTNKISLSKISLEETDLTFTKKRLNTLAAGFSVGTMFNLTNNVALDLSYRYLNLGSIYSNIKPNTALGFFEKTRPLTKDRMQNNNIMAKLVIKL